MCACRDGQCGLRHCHWLLAVSHHYLGSYPSRCMWESCQWLGVKRWFSPHSGFLNQLQLASHDLAAIWQKKSIFVIPWNKLRSFCTRVYNTNYSVIYVWSISAIITSMCIPHNSWVVSNEIYWCVVLKIVYSSSRERLIGRHLSSDFHSCPNNAHNFKTLTNLSRTK